MVKNRNWLLKPVIDEIEYIVILSCQLENGCVPDEIAVSLDGKILYRVGIHANSHAEAELLAILELEDYLKRRE